MRSLFILKLAVAKLYLFERSHEISSEIGMSPAELLYLHGHMEGRSPVNYLSNDRLKIRGEKAV